MLAQDVKRRQAGHAVALPGRRAVDDDKVETRRLVECREVVPLGSSTGGVDVDQRRRPHLGEAIELLVPELGHRLLGPASVVVERQDTAFAAAAEIVGEQQRGNAGTELEDGAQLQQSTRCWMSFSVSGVMAWPDQ